MAYRRSPRGSNFDKPEVWGCPAIVLSVLGGWRAMTVVLLLVETEAMATSGRYRNPHFIQAKPAARTIANRALFTFLLTLQVRSQGAMVATGPHR